MTPPEHDQSEVPSKPRVPHSTRITVAALKRLEAEAALRGVAPSKLSADLIEAGLCAVQAAPETVTVRVADLHRAIEEAVRHAA